MTANTIGFALLILVIFLVIGKWVRVLVPLFQNLYLPSSLVAGLLALLIGPEIFGKVFGFSVLDPEWLSVWAALPGLMINVIFASLFIGKKIPSLKEIWRLAGPQVMSGYVISFGQYAVGLGLAVFLLAPVFGVNPLAGALIEIGFVGGHGTAAGMRQTFELLDFPEGGDLAIGMATVGVLAGVIIGIALINWGMRTGKLAHGSTKEDRSALERKGIVEFEMREPAGFLSTRAESIEPLSLHAGYIGVAIVIGFLLLQGLIQLEAFTWGAWTDMYLMTYVPLFPLTMVGGIVVQLVLSRVDPYATVDRQLINRVQGFSLDILIVSALATLSLSVIGNHLPVFIILSAGGIVWTVFAFLVLIPRLMPDYWFERGIGDFGQSMGVTATGLLLMRVADPDQMTPAMSSFGYKQLLFELFVGGGLFTAASVPLIAQLGPEIMFAVSLILTVIPIIIGVMMKHMRKKSS